MTSAGIFWIIAAVLFAVIEAATVALVTVWFAVGALAAAIAAQFGASILFQVGTFVVVLRAILLCVTRPVFKKISVKKPQRTNADRFIGEEAMVIKKIDDINNDGQVKIAGQVWSAVSEDKSPLEEGTIVKVIAIRGVKLVVEPINS